MRESDKNAREDEHRGGERSGGGGYETDEPRRAPPSPWDSPPFPTSEYQGYPLIGVPPSPTEDPMHKALLLGPYGDAIKESRIEFHGWATMSGNWSNARNSNLPTAYWVVPNSFQLDQLITRFEREADTVQTDHIDWGFRAVGLYGIDYRYTTAGGVFSQQLLYHNSLYGFDPGRVLRRAVHPEDLRGDVDPGWALDCLPRHRGPVRAGQLPGLALTPLHLRHVHPDRRHVQLPDQPAEHDSGCDPVGHRHGTVVRRRHCNRLLRLAVGIRVK